MVSDLSVLMIPHCRSIRLGRWGLGKESVLAYQHALSQCPYEKHYLPFYQLDGDAFEIMADESNDLGSYLIPIKPALVKYFCRHNYGLPTDSGNYVVFKPFAHLMDGKHHYFYNQNGLIHFDGRQFSHKPIRFPSLCAINADVSTSTIVASDGKSIHILEKGKYCGFPLKRVTGIGIRPADNGIYIDCLIREAQSRQTITLFKSGSRLICVQTQCETLMPHHRSVLRIPFENNTLYVKWESCKVLNGNLCMTGWILFEFAKGKNHFYKFHLMLKQWENWELFNILETLLNQVLQSGNTPVLMRNNKPIYLNLPLIETI